MAHVKSGGAARQHAQRPGKRLGVKIFGGQEVKTGQIIVRQRGAQFHAGSNTQLGRDFSLYATAPGAVKFKKNKGVSYVEVNAQ
ncbi:MAG: 50S ribosomal protein L27 [Candidatus Collierbacteria bacterium GW2011_GWC1_45_47]|uniref:Large ribosomal subunit protein bL27 n=6 Tax=Candidatus Collieribacteriota TaxID=1752725 RepID=A0A0G1HHK1_9BACT|nr:MAG: 50S ribosomal protein L27 [Candidatus Collierbacteria bacterium GW2011_GWA1_44_12]KKT37593.1 MAG: 50S ribosomal protein L27 [Candidatus Collierbacteria bacterium GW2011_GWF1_44_12]KKT46726.1 MAG: 50S ribosomal protein L27 [Candidatus Collierbacteria bacterium GW2011_GWF2_44_15]KKT67818.1 MAG: 50S ribosomal protein L27 [Candidatus Collierbacteria bacterium GW2011_GWB1_44_35]KKT98877.1 MAG: 50S ribosomal protein L27 [Candidatus Collierbacteria bacterium GW2011_GWC2_45_15]KKU08999.1 MAG: 